MMICPKHCRHEHGVFVLDLQKENCSHPPNLLIVNLGLNVVLAYQRTHYHRYTSGQLVIPASSMLQNCKGRIRRSNGQPNFTKPIRQAFLQTFMGPCLSLNSVE